MRVSGKVRFLPTLLENRRNARIAKGEEGLPPKKYVHISHVDIIDSEIDFYDATITQKPHLIPFRHVHGEVEQLKLPTLDEEAALDLTGTASANGHTGKISLRGKLVPHNAEAEANSNATPLFSAPYNLTGSGVTVMVRDEGRV